MTYFEKLKSAKSEKEMAALIVPLCKAAIITNDLSKVLFSEDGMSVRDIYICLLGRMEEELEIEHEEILDEILDEFVKDRG